MTHTEVEDLGALSGVVIAIVAWTYFWYRKWKARKWKQDSHRG